MKKIDAFMVYLVFTVIVLGGLLIIAAIALAADADQIAGQRDQIAALEAINFELTDQLDEAERQITELVTEDAPAWGEAKTETEAVDSAEVDLLARLIMCEMGSDGHPDEQLYNVGSVILNRVADDRFPNTVRGVIYQSSPCWQYAPARDGTLEKAKPTARCYEIAEDLLTSGSRLPAAVVWQSTEPQGSAVYAAYYSPVTGETTYFCK